MECYKYFFMFDVAFKFELHVTYCIRKKLFNNTNITIVLI